MSLEISSAKEQPFLVGRSELNHPWIFRVSSTPIMIAIYCKSSLIFHTSLMHVFYGNIFYGLSLWMGNSWCYCLDNDYPNAMRRVMNTLPLTNMVTIPQTTRLKLFSWKEAYVFQYIFIEYKYGNSNHYLDQGWPVSPKYMSKLAKENWLAAVLLEH